MHWLNSLRAIPPRTARFVVRPRKLSQDGSNVGDYLAYDTVAGHGELIQQVSLAFDRITGHHLQVLRLASSGEAQYSIVLTPADAPEVQIPIMDTGEGMAQVLPVVVLGCLAKLGRLGKHAVLAIEHPELHLHPSAHADLSAFFCDVISSVSQPAIVIETHSENLLLRLQIAIARGEIAKEDVIVHWIRALSDGQSVAETITFDHLGRPSAWPPGVFREDTEQARKLIELRKGRS